MAASQGFAAPYYCPFLWQLCEADRFLYVCLKSTVSSNAAKSPRNLRLNTFSENLEAIKTFVCRNDKDDSLRGMICGIYWLPDGLAINIHRLRQLVPKCKSSINGSLQKLGFTVNLGRSECAQAVTALFPLLKENAELRKWTIRKQAGYQRMGSPGSIPVHERFEISLDGLKKDRPGLNLPRFDFRCEFDRDIRVPEDPIDDPMMWDRVHHEDVARGVFPQFGEEMWIGTQ
jgi:hypothetical protein